MFAKKFEDFDRQLYLFNLIRCCRQLLLGSSRTDPQKRQICIQSGLILLETAEQFSQTAQHVSRQIPSDPGIVSPAPEPLPSLPQNQSCNRS